MSTQDLTRLVRELRARVPADAAELLVKETPDRIEEALKQLPPSFASRVAAHLPDGLIPSSFASAAENVAPGSIADLMEAPRGVLSPETTVAQAVEYLRGAEGVGEITYLYVVGANQGLLGLVVMRDLLLADLQQPLSEVMISNPFRFTVDADVLDAVKAAARRQYPVYPVCDAEGRLVGLVRGWRLMEAQAFEISAQSGRMVGLTKEEMLATPILRSFRMRHPWLQLNLLTAFLAAAVVSLFEDTITQIVTLAAFLPVLAGQSGNTGCQALAITLRGMTLGEFESFPLRRLVIKEVLLGAANGVFTGLVAGIAMLWSAGGLKNPQALDLGLVILLAMTGACMASGFFGVMVPIALRRLGADPATASSIFLTTGTDIAGMGLMLFLATTIVL
jgi:magnesium transporter